MPVSQARVYFPRYWQLHPHNIGQTGIRHTASVLQRLPKQVSELPISEANRFCCSNWHVMPSTGMRIPCDRVLVFRTLQGWSEDLNVV